MTQKNRTKSSARDHARRNRSSMKERTLVIQMLEKREVPAIALIGTELTVTAGDSNDAVVISPQVVSGQSMITARRTETVRTPFGTTVFNESQNFLASRVATIRVTLGNGVNSFRNSTNLPSIAIGGSGNDTMNGGSAKDIFTGMAGNDRLLGNGGPDNLVGGDGDDSLEGGDGNDNILGGNGEDSIQGDQGNDLINGEAGRDTIHGGLGADTLFGGLDTDSIFGGPAVATSLLDEGNTISGGDGDDILHGNDGNDSISGDAGNDRLYGREGADTLNGGTGDDTIEGAEGNDSLVGGLGNDEIFGGLGNDSVMAGGGNDRVFGEDGADLLNGEAGNDWLDGGRDDDEIRGGDGDDRLHGGWGLDRLFGEIGKDTLIGGDHADFLIGGDGVDTIVAIDGGIDQIMPGVIATTTVRDELWLDPQDTSLNNSAAIASVQAIDPRAVHIVKGYRKFSINGELITTPVSLGANLFDPKARAVDMGLTNKVHDDLPLFSSAGPQYTDIDQGAVGSCYFLARLASLAKTHPQYLRDMVADLGDGTYAVQFFFQNGTKTFVRVDNSLYMRPAGDKPMYTNLGAEGSMWAAIIEKAWAIHRYATASYDDISGGNSEQTNTSVALGLNQIDTMTSAIPNKTSFVNLIQSELNAGRTVLIPAPAGLNDNTPMTNENRQRGSHVYMVHSIVTNAQGAPSKILMYNLYGEPLIEITNFDMLYWCSAKIAVAWPK